MAFPLPKEVKFVEWANHKASLSKHPGVGLKLKDLEEAAKTCNPKSGKDLTELHDALQAFVGTAEKARAWTKISKGVPPETVEWLKGVLKVAQPFNQKLENLMNGAEGEPIYGEGGGKFVLPGGATVERDRSGKEEEDGSSTAPAKSATEKPWKRATPSKEEPVYQNQEKPATPAKEEPVYQNQEKPATPAKEEPVYQNQEKPATPSKEEPVYQNQAEENPYHNEVLDRGLQGAASVKDVVAALGKAHVPTSEISAAVQANDATAWTKLLTKYKVAKDSIGKVVNGLLHLPAASNDPEKDARKNLKKELAVATKLDDVFWALRHAGVSEGEIAAAVQIKGGAGWSGLLAKHQIDSGTIEKLLNGALKPQKSALGSIPSFDPSGASWPKYLDLAKQAGLDLAKLPGADKFLLAYEAHRKGRLAFGDQLKELQHLEAGPAATEKLDESRQTLAKLKESGQIAKLAHKYVAVLSAWSNEAYADPGVAQLLDSMFRQATLFAGEFQELERLENEISKLAQRLDPRQAANPRPAPAQPSGTAGPSSGRAEADYQNNG